MCKMLNATNRFNPRMLEWFHDKNRRRYEQMAATPRNCKTFPYQIHNINENYSLDFVEERHPDVKWIYATRADKVAQVASRIMAVQTNVWHVDRTRSKPRTYKPVVVSEQDVVEHFEKILLNDQQTVEAMTTRDHLVVWYEDFAFEPRKTVNGILSYLGVPASASAPVEVAIYRPDKHKIIQQVAEWMDKLGLPSSYRYDGGRSIGCS